MTVIDKENGGHGSTINAGLQAAGGRYFRVLDSDDWFDTCNFIKYFRALRHCREDVVITPYTQEYAYNGQRVDYPYSYFKHDRVYQMEDLVFDESMPYFTMASSTYRTQLLRDCGLKLFEKCFYVDMIFNMVPIPYVKTVRFLNHYVYRYFMGSPTQSMSQANLMRNLPNHERVLNFLIDYYVAHRETVGDNVRNYMEQMIYFMYYTHMDLVCMKLSDRKKAYKMFRELDESLKARAGALSPRGGVPVSARDPQTALSQHPRGQQGVRGRDESCQAHPQEGLKHEEDFCDQLVLSPDQFLRGACDVEALKPLGAHLRRVHAKQREGLDLRSEREV